LYITEAEFSVKKILDFVHRRLLLTSWKKRHQAW